MTIVGEETGGTVGLGSTTAVTSAVSVAGIGVAVLGTAVSASAAGEGVAVTLSWP
jgi:hypothetical protein